MQIRRVIVQAGVVFALSVGCAAAVSQAAPDGVWKPVTSIDFSAKHNVLILNPDGSLSRMDEPHFTSKLIAPGTWQMLDDGDYMYLVEGDNEAIMIDSGYGAGNSRAYAQTLTKKPLRYVANTHPHFDHTANDGYFDRAYMSAGTKEHLPAPSGSFKGVTFPMNFPIEVIGDGYTFHLGNRDLEVITLGNHAPGGTAYLDRKQRILYSGDEIMGKQGVSIRLTVEQFEKLMEKLAAHRSEYDTLCAGWEILDASWVDKYLAVSKYILAGHEGVPLAEAPPAPQPNNWPIGPAPVDPEGRTVYIRHVPRMSDSGRPSSGVPGQPATGAGADPNMRRMTYGGATVTYDVRKIKD